MPILEALGMRSRSRAKPTVTPKHNAPMAVLRDAAGIPVPLTGVRATGRLEGLIFELNVEQRYENRSGRNLEAVYTFPLPFRAVLLGFDLEIDGRKLAAVAVARREASERYEQAIDAGHTAALIEHDGHGLYTVSLGNLQPGETAVIRYRYAELLDAHQGYVRLSVPTVIAPRFGDPRDAGLEGPAVPTVDLLGEYPFEIRLTLAGLADISAIRSPTHRIAVEAAPGGLSVALAGEAFLDRDFVLELSQAALPTAALVARDGEDYVTLASATLAADTAEARPLALKILLDCSGSMGGDSIAAARRALLVILERLAPADRLGLTRFGSTYEHLTEGLEPADEHTLMPLKAVVRQLDADLGGTEMEQALNATLEIPTPRDATRDVLLITDGQIQDIAGVVARAAQSGHRLFAIAIGAAPVEALARQLAGRTGGSCEFVGPGDDIEAAILRTFKRLRATQRTLRTVLWPQDLDWTAPVPEAVFPGDTLHAFAGHLARPSGEVSFRVQDAGGNETALNVPVAEQLTEGDLLPRLAAARRIATLDAAAARELAERYQLATEHTSFVVVDVRADGAKAEQLPATVAVAHMLAAGWGGTSQLLRQNLSMPESRASYDMQACVSSPDRFDRGSYASASIAGESGTPARVSALDTSTCIGLLMSIHEADAKGLPFPTTLAELRDEHKLPKDACRSLKKLWSQDGQCTEAEFVAIFLAMAALMVGQAWPDMFDEAFLERLKGSVLGDRRYRALRMEIRRMMSP